MLPGPKTQTEAITKGKDALGEVSVQVKFKDAIVTGKGSSTDIVEAGAKAYINCTNRYLTEKARTKTKPAKAKAKAKRKAS